MGKPVNRRPGRDESPFAEQDVDVEQGVRSLLNGGESAVVEFKSTARCNLHTGKADPAITWAVVKTIAAFMNTHGGTLLIGLDDEGRPVGIESDYSFVKGGDRDGWELWLTAVVKTALGVIVATDVSCALLRNRGPDGRPARCTPWSGTGIRLTKGRAAGFFLRPPQQLDGRTLGTSTARLPTEALAGIDACSK